MKYRLLLSLFTLLPFALHAEALQPFEAQGNQEEQIAQTLKVATFNVSMESTNYKALGLAPSAKVLQQVLSNGDNQQVKNIAEIIQRVNPDILLLNEFDYIADQSVGIDNFIKHYLNVSQAGQKAVDYGYVYTNTVNTGEPTNFDLDNNGKKEQYGGDAYGYGLYPGQYGMVVLSKYPIDHDSARTFQTFKWQDMPDAQQPILPASNTKEAGTPWYSEEEWQTFRLSSKSHWDIPVSVNGEIVHVLAMHPTPPNFDGEEDRNGTRNHDEIRLMADYLTPKRGGYIYDDAGAQVSLKENERFVLVGDFNAADIGDKHRPDVIEQLTESPLVNNSLIPTSAGGAEASNEAFSNRFTAYWGARADYVLPSQYGFDVKDAGVFWPTKDSDLYRLVKDRQASSDHRMVWVSLAIN